MIFITAADSLHHFTDGCSGSPLCPFSLCNRRSFTYLCITMLSGFKSKFLSSYLEDVVIYIYMKKQIAGCCWHSKYVRVIINTFLKWRMFKTPRCFLDGWRSFSSDRYNTALLPHGELFVVFSLSKGV